MNKQWYRGLILVLLACCAIICVSPVFAENTRTITDMVGRSVTIPTEIHSILGTAPPTSEAVYMIKPDDLIGINFDLKNSSYVPEKYKSLPNVGGQQMGSKLNYETFQSMKPDIVLYGFDPAMGGNQADIEDVQTRLNPIPVVACADSTNATNYGPEIKFLGTLLGAEDRANSLNSFYDNLYKKVTTTVASIPDDQKKKVYYAEGPDGLKTDPASSPHGQLIAVCGGNNVAEVSQGSSGGMSPVSMEQVVSWNPDVIVAGDKKFYKSVMTDPNWKDIKAVKDKQVYLIPNQPFGWIDRPPGANRIIGIPWLAKVIYPEKFTDIDLNSLIKEYYTKYLNYDITDTEVNTIITYSGLTA
ncbi:ABC transporter substrate-binding protein [Methanospirillum lacunae]|uniref:Iron ABC transporter substrate-binding protein n=1 Tax=Methanospirillum lacunae TaxID=668570 RepID=A0A2V2N546_9EURY|nr:ABC transporter substrate-binding protein [Methanospirillum lacunae]PWR71327.1 iron ABC transporter substrate-binding protein [Methanospirillum lacunae]